MPTFSPHLQPSVKMNSLCLLEPSRQLELRMVHMVTLGLAALKQCSFSSGPGLRAILNPLGLTEAPVEGWPNEITLSNRNSSFAAVMSQPVRPGVQMQKGVLSDPVARGTSAADPRRSTQPPSSLAGHRCSSFSSPVDLQMYFYPKAPGFTLSRQRNEVAVIWGSDQGPAVSEDSTVSLPGTCHLYFSTGWWSNVSNSFVWKVWEFP